MLPYPPEEVDHPLSLGEHVDGEVEVDEVVPADRVELLVLLLLVRSVLPVLGNHIVGVELAALGALQVVLLEPVEHVRLLPVGPVLIVRSGAHSIGVGSH